MRRPPQEPRVLVAVFFFARLVEYLRRMASDLSKESWVIEKAKSSARHLLRALRLDLTKNLAYDRMTDAIIKRHVKPGMNCIDVGCHKGEILELLLRQSPEGRHLGFEPIPAFARGLAAKFNGHPGVEIIECALSDTHGTSTFQYVTNAPAYSGIRQRSYAVENPQIEQIQVRLRPLDDWFTPDLKWDFLKIDVEGGELAVLRGAEQILRVNQPLVVFECGLGASDFYGTTAEDVHGLLSAQLGYRLHTLKGFLSKPSSAGLSRDEFQAMFEQNAEYYFVASPSSST